MILHICFSSNLSERSFFACVGPHRFGMLAERVCSGPKTAQGRACQWSYTGKGAQNTQHASGLLLTESID